MFFVSAHWHLTNNIYKKSNTTSSSTTNQTRATTIISRWIVSEYGIVYRCLLSVWLPLLILLGPQHFRYQQRSYQQNSINKQHKTKYNRNHNNQPDNSNYQNYHNNRYFGSEDVFTDGSMFFGW
jgi:hypothetical protein